MELTKLLDLLSNEPTKLVTIIEKSKPEVDYEKIKKQYDPLQHDVIIDTVKYPDKKVNTTTETTYKPVARISIPFQEMIVNVRGTFLCGNPIELISSTESDTEKNLVKVLQKTWDDNKLDYESKTLAKLMMSETDCAELWFSEEAKEGYWKGTPNDKQGVKARLRVKILANSLGDSLYPVFNVSGDMIAFARGYEITDEEDKKVKHFDIYTDEFTYLGIKGETEWEFKKEANPHKKIPVIYYSQPRVEWYSVQTPIDRFEMSISRHGNANDYMGFPLMAVYGKIQSFADKGDDGKVIELDPGAKLEMVVWPQAPESVKLEQQTLLDIIYTMSGTPKMSGEELSKAGNYSGAALKMRFLPAHMKAADKEETFGKGIQRRINFLKAALAVVNTEFEAVQYLNIKPKFKYYLPKNEQEEINILTGAVSGEIMSKETAIDLNPLIENKEVEKERVKAEKEEEEKLNTSPTGLTRLMNSDAA